MKRLLIALASLPFIGADHPPTLLTLTVEGLRSDRGEVLVCLIQDEAEFPDCREGGGVRALSAPAAPSVHLVLRDLQPGPYAVAIIHDENGNGLLDRNFLGIPTEGIGFSRNPRIRFGPPRFEAARFELPRETDQEIRIRYFL